MKLARVTITTDASGDGQGSTEVLKGFIRRVYYKKTDYADGIDFTIADASGATLFTGTNVNASAAYHPRQATHDNAGAASLYAAAGEPVESDLPVDGTLTITVAAGGDTKTGEFFIWVG